MKTLKLLFILSFFLPISGCSSNEESNSEPESFPFSSASYYFKSTENIEINVYYQSGAEPYEGNRFNGDAWWKVTGDNLSSAFQYRTTTPTITYPTTVAEMNLLSQADQTTWSAQQVLDLHNEVNPTAPTQTTARFYIYFLNGNASSGNSVIGFSITNTPIIAIFKDVIESSSSLQVVRNFVEQSTIVHELGHALGSVNNGVPLASDHQDSDNGAHTTNDECVMYYLNEGASDLVTFIQRYRTSQSTVMWGSEVLADFQAYSE